MVGLHSIGGLQFDSSFLDGWMEGRGSEKLCKIQMNSQRSRIIIILRMWWHRMMVDDGWQVEWSWSRYYR